LIGLGDVGSASDGDIAVVKIELPLIFSSIEKLFVQLNVRSGLSADLSFDVIPVVTIVYSSQTIYSVQNAVSRYFLEGGTSANDPWLGYRVMDIDSSNPSGAKATVKIFRCGPICQAAEMFRWRIFDTICRKTGSWCYLS